ncbi:YdcF family protein [Phormidium sp. LEGE 05292]|uniref:YdcF family protein n=1 Tax=[Phormidium] sp. LEGE 05292 TaxID=767427 RepID=UPI00187F1FBF|nr:YdcF family protein [Phormidium sp. LEGE 05292]MBE9227120.1 YdcF family protein [Phormidium sp. LEGE 05292]
MLFLTLTQLIFLTLIVWLVWRVVFRPRKDGDPGAGGLGEGKYRPRDYLAWLGALIVFLAVILALLTPNNGAVVQVWSIISLPLKPLGLSILLLLFALMGIAKGGITNDAKLYIRIATALLLFFSIPIIAFLMVQLIESDSILALQAAAHRKDKVDAIVLLGQATTQQPFLEANQIHLTDAGDRILQAAREYEQQSRLGNDAFIIVSAGPRPGQRLNPNQPNPPEAFSIARILKNLGIPESAIIIEPTGVDIRTSAEAIRRKYVDEGIISKRVILVASALNMQRARQSFAQLGISTIPSPATFYTFQAGGVPRVIFMTTQKDRCDTISITFRNAREVQFSDFMPNVDSLLLSTRVINEFWSSVYYFLRGWLSTGVDPIPQPQNIRC